jgi:cytochrome c oxidase assembly protein subunit 15
MQVTSLLLLLAIGAALGLACWLGLRQQGRANFYPRLIGLTAFLTFDLIVFGGFTRLTDAGLGCPDWPGCYAQASPFQAQQWIELAEQQLPSGPVTLVKAWIEMLHRYFAMGVGFLIMCIMISAWRQRQQASPWFATILFGLVCVQGAFGAWTVTMKLQPLIVTVHLLLGLTLFAGLIWLYSRQQMDSAILTVTQSVPQTLAQLDRQGQAKIDLVQQAGPISPPMRTPRTASYQASYMPPVVPRSLTYWAIFALAILVLQIASGGWVSTNYAVLACPDFPLCHGQWLPEMDFAQGFTLWRDLGKDAAGNMITMPALTAIHWLHRVLAGVTFCVLARLIYLLGQHSLLRSLAYRLSAVLILQIVTGITNISLQWPLIGAILHNAGAALLVFLLIRINYLVCRSN